MDFKARASISIKAPIGRAWSAITTPETLKRFFFGSEVESDWRVGSPIYWRGSWQGKPYEDKGILLEFTPPNRLVTTHWSPLSGSPDVPANYHTVTYELEDAGDETVVSIVQDGSASQAEADHSAENWRRVLKSLKALLEGADSA